jgi:hypothetical protein
LVAHWIEGLARQGWHGIEADAPRDLAAGVLEMPDLRDQTRLPGLLSGLKEGVNLIQEPDDDLQPVGFGAAEFLDF